MKKYFYFAIAALAFASCANDDIIGGGEISTSQDAAISFGGATTAMTRADHTGSQAATLLDNNFVIEGVKGHGSFGSYADVNVVFDHYNVNWTTGTANTTESNTSDWEYVNQDQNIKGTSAKLSGASQQAIKFWDYNTAQYDYVAVSLGKGVGATPTYATLSKINYNNIGSNANAVYTLTGSAEELSSAYIADLVTLYNQGGVSEYGTIVTPRFRSLGTKVRVAFYETVPGYSINNVKFYYEAWDGSKTSTDGSADATLFAASNVFPAAGTKGVMSVYYPTVGFNKSGKDGNPADADYNQAHIMFAAAAGGDLATTKTFGTLDYKQANEGGESSSVKYLGRTSAEATYAGTATENYYQVVLPLGSSDNLQVRIEYDLIPIDGGKETIHVRDARAVVPAAYCDWKPNYAYTYIFKISDTTNGWTGVDGSGNIVEGLTPITFDAVVTETTDGIQETITTVSTPSITTYQEGKVVTAGSEYVAGVAYASVMNGTTPVTLTAANAAFYEATATDSKIITEALVQDQLAGKKHDTGITLTSAGCNIVSEVPAADGNTLQVSAAQFTVESGKTYVFVYAPAVGEYHVKVIRVQ